MKTALASHPDLVTLAGLFNLGYATTSALWHNGHCIQSSKGARQGDPLGSLLFCLALHPILLDAQQKFGTVHVKAYMDDVTIYGPRKDVAACFDHITAQATKIGLRAHMKKCHWLGDKSSQSHMPTGMTFHDARSDCIHILGAYVGHEDTAKQLLHDDVMTRLTEHMQRVKKVGGHEELLILLKSLIPRVGFAIRTHTPHVTRRVAQAFDEACLQLLEELASATVSPTQQIICLLPQTLGGMGMHNATLIAEHAYAASLAAAMIDISTPHEDYVTAVNAVESQRARVQPIYAALLQTITTDPDTHNLLSDSSCSSSSAWLRECSEVLAPLTPAEVGAALRLRLGLRHAANPSLKCPGCHMTLSVTRQAAHLAGCTHIHGNNSSHAHAELKRAGKQISNFCGVSYDDHEPTDFTLIICPGALELELDRSWASTTSFSRSRTEPHSLALMPFNSHCKSRSHRNTSTWRSRCYTNTNLSSAGKR